MLDSTGKLSPCGERLHAPTKLPERASLKHFGDSDLPGGGTGTKNLHRRALQHIILVLPLRVGMNGELGWRTKPYDELPAESRKLFEREWL